MTSLREYRSKRDFTTTSEPKGSRKLNSSHGNTFVIQEHHATRLHWDFRLEADRVLKSWAVTKEPSKEIGLRRLAIQTEDHPLEYGKFRGEIPEGEYGAGKVEIWDHGTYESQTPVSDAMDRGLIEIWLSGNKLKGRYVLVRTRGEGPKSMWLFFRAKPKTVKLKIPDPSSVKRAPRKRVA